MFGLEPVAVEWLAVGALLSVLGVLIRFREWTFLVAGYDRTSPVPDEVVANVAGNTVLRIGLAALALGVVTALVDAPSSLPSSSRRSSSSPSRDPSTDSAPTRQLTRRNTRDCERRACAWTDAIPNDPRSPLSTGVVALRVVGFVGIRVVRTEQARADRGPRLGPPRALVPESLRLHT